jgi:hypothetical protein
MEQQRHTSQMFHVLEGLESIVGKKWRVQLDISFPLPPDTSVMIRVVEAFYSSIT